jgi:hypothetical protein
MQQDTFFQPEKRTVERCSLNTYFAGFPHLAARRTDPQYAAPSVWPLGSEIARLKRSCVIHGQRKQKAPRVTGTPGAWRSAFWSNDQKATPR